MNISHNDVSQILKVIDDTQNLDEVELVVDGMHLHVRRSAQPGPAQSPSFAAVAQPAPPDKPPATSQASALAAPPEAPMRKRTTEIPEGATAIRAPMLGAFYRAPSPGEPPFVQVGQQVQADDTVCIIEVMKLFNSIKAGVEGEVVQILVEDGELVEYNQLLIVIFPGRKVA